MSKTTEAVCNCANSIDWNHWMAWIIIGTIICVALLAEAISDIGKK